MAINMDRLIEKWHDKRSKVRHGNANSKICGDDVGFVIWNQQGKIWRMKWYGHGCVVTCGFAQHLCDMLDLSDVEEMYPKALALQPEGISNPRQSCVKVVLDALNAAVNDTIR